MERIGPRNTVDLNGLTPQEIADLFKRPVPLEKSNHLYMYAIVRRDLDMPPGKLSAQAGHAYTDSLMSALEISEDLVKDYRNLDKGGSKVTLKSKNLNQLLKAYDKAKELGLPCALIVDQHHILPPHFDGSPVVTALGIGPCTKEACKEITKKFNCV